MPKDPNNFELLRVALVLCCSHIRTSFPHSARTRTLMYTFFIVAGSVWLGLASGMVLGLARAGKRPMKEVPWQSEAEA